MNNKQKGGLVKFIFFVLGQVLADSEVRCQPGSTFKQECNTCFCGKDGKTAACTLMACYGVGKI